MFERFTQEARDVVAGAQAQALRMGHGFIGTEHLLLGMLERRECRAAQVLADLGVGAPRVRGEIVRIVGLGAPDLDADALATIGIDLDEVRTRVEATFGPGALARRGGRCGVMSPRVPFTARAKKVLELALREAMHRGDRRIGSEHVLLGLTREGEGVAARILRSRGVDGAAVEAALGRRRAADA